MTLDEAIKKIAELEERIRILESRHVAGFYSAPWKLVGPMIVDPAPDSTWVPHFNPVTCSRGY